MTLDRTRSSGSAIDVLDHVLDKGIVIDAWMRVSLDGIDLVTVEARIVVASVGTYVANGGAIVPRTWHPAPPSPSLERPLSLPREQIEHCPFEPPPPRRAQDTPRGRPAGGRATTIATRPETR